MTAQSLPNSPINGQTRLIAIVGDPIAQVRSPDIYNPRLAARGHNAVLLPVHLPVAQFDEGIRGLMQVANIAGLVITYPFKDQAMRLVDHVGAVATQVGAINAMRREPDGRWTGDMFDGAGLLAALHGLGQSAEGRRITLVGAGGAGSAIGIALAAAGAASLRICDLIDERARLLVQRIARAYPNCAAEVGPATIDDRDLLINATPVGMAPDFALAPFVGTLRPGLTVIDIVPKPEQTKLLDAARAAGCPNTNGQAMISGQADEVLAFLGFRRPA